jgi:hypothetical protein
MVGNLRYNQIRGPRYGTRPVGRTSTLVRTIDNTGLSYAQDTSGENPYINIKDILKLLIIGDSAVRLLITLKARSA